MNPLILDTDITSLYRAGHSMVTAKVLATPPAALGITIITVEEMLNGWYRKLRQKNDPQRLEAIYEQMTFTFLFLCRFHIYNYTAVAHRRFLALDALKLNVGAYDLRIAAVALEVGATVITRNRRDFERVPHLLIEDWSAQ